MGSQASLSQQLINLEGKSYKAYKDLKGSYNFQDFQLFIDYVQGDPFAAPSRLRILLSQNKAAYPKDLWQHPIRATALADFITRVFYQEVGKIQSRRGSGKSGQIAIAPPSQAILERSAAQVGAEGVEIRFCAGLPAFGRRIAGRQAAELLCDDIPALAQRSLFYQALDPEAIQLHCDTAEDAHSLRQQLPGRGLVAFISNGAVLPRRSGIDERPLEDGLPFQAPASMQVQMTCPHAGTRSGMGIPEGITLIVGGGYHGKSTLLQAIEAGIYNHIPGDGREQVIAVETATKVRAEDGRSITGVDISPFINHLPQGKSTRSFSTPNASGSTSQAANIIEAIEAGAQLLLVDEDTSATNFMIRDRRMQALIAKQQEPITPFIDKVKQLHTDLGISTILVMGGSGDYFDVADRVVALNSYRPQEVTQQAKAIAAEYATLRTSEGGAAFGQLAPRVVQPRSIDPRRGKRDVSLKVRSLDEIRIGSEGIDLTAVEQIIETGQLRAIAAAIVYAQRHWLDGKASLAEALDGVMADLDQCGLDCLEERKSGDLAAFRRLELAAAINRLRTLAVLQAAAITE